MTKKLFWDNPYQTTLDTKVTSVDGTEITVGETIFYAFSGGQESDKGTIGGHSVLEARMAGDEIIYVMPAAHEIGREQTVRIVIDWARRYSLMRLHFAAELVLALFYKNIEGVDKIGAHIAEDKARLDFALEKNISPLLPGIEAEVNAIIASDYKIKSAFENGSNERRYWEIAGLFRVPCGGTHIAGTGEIGLVKLKRNNIGRGKERVEIRLI